MDPARRNIIVDTALETIWPTMQAHGRDSCITGARILFDVCGHYGLGRKVLKVAVVIYNEPMSERLRRGERPKDVETVKRWGKEDGSWNVGIGADGTPDRPDHFNGHLVVLVDDKLLVDPTLPQANRPEYGIELYPLAVLIEDESDIYGGEVRDCIITYKIDRDDDRRWVPTESWQNRTLRQPIVDVVIAACDKALESAAAAV